MLVIYCLYDMKWNNTIDGIIRIFSALEWHSHGKQMMKLSYVQLIIYEMKLSVAVVYL